jgi:hypothetical protein
VNVGGLEEVQSNDPAVMKSTSLGSLDSGNEHVQDLHVKVEDPEKHIEGYVSYYVLTKVRFTVLYREMKIIEYVDTKKDRMHPVIFTM